MAHNSTAGPQRPTVSQQLHKLVAAPQANYRKFQNDAGSVVSHELVAVQTHPRTVLQQQISLHADNAFGILRTIIDVVREQEDGEYILLKDPNKSILRLYSVPEGAFDPDEDDEEDEEEESRRAINSNVVSAVCGSREIPNLDGKRNEGCR